MDDMELAAIAQGWKWSVRFLPWIAGWVLIWGAAAACHHRSIWGCLLAIGMTLGGVGRSWPTIAGDAVWDALAADGAWI
ncbi:hypothetical protein ACLOJK_036666 [Asimina triloba]